MSKLLEIMFENVFEDNVIPLLLMLIGKPRNIIKVQCSEETNLVIDGRLDVYALNFVLKNNGDVTVIISLYSIEFGDVLLPKALLRLVKYGKKYDIDFTFDSNELEKTDMDNLLSELHGHAIEIAKDNDIGAFFCGMEPASDEDTRYFTNYKLGPLSDLNGHLL